MLTQDDINEEKLMKSQDKSGTKSDSGKPKSNKENDENNEREETKPKSEK